MRWLQNVGFVSNLSLLYLQQKTKSKMFIERWEIFVIEQETIGALLKARAILRLTNLRLFLKNFIIIAIMTLTFFWNIEKNVMFDILSKTDEIFITNSYVSIRFTDLNRFLQCSLHDLGNILVYKVFKIG